MLRKQNRDICTELVTERGLIFPSLIPILKQSLAGRHGVSLSVLSLAAIGALGRLAALALRL